MSQQSYIEITLLADLCVGSGPSFAGVIDSDVVSDQYGIPYIPARRLKGCLREAAEMIRPVLGPNVIETLFGEGGKKIPGKLYIENARMVGYEDIIEAAGRSDFAWPYSKETVLRQFTSVRAQTAVDQNGIADDNSLRFIRVVNRVPHYAKDDQPLKFRAAVTYSDQNPEDLTEDLANIAKAMRHIGMNRNRGIGNVRCELIQVETDIPSSLQNQTGITADQSPVEIRYTIMNTAPLMISQGSDNVSETYIPGRMILGALATAYLAEGHSAEDSTFRELFLNGRTTQFLNAYIADDRGERCYPVPGYINRLKKTKLYVNVERIHEASKKNADRNQIPQEYRPDGGNQPKRLTGVYCSIDEKHKIHQKETIRSLTYHHRQENKERKQEVQLYPHLEIAEGQQFVGVIRTQKAYEPLVRSLLLQGMRIGKSRNAQYGTCVVQIAEDSAPRRHTLTVSAGDDVLVSLNAPAIITQNGQETIRYEEVFQKVAEDLGISNIIDNAYYKGKEDASYGILDTRLIYGYQSVWNLRRTPVAAISESSVLVYHIADNLPEEWTIDCSKMVGERQLEGYGEIHIERMQDMGYQLEISAEKKHSVTNMAGIVDPESLPAILQDIHHAISAEMQIEDAKNSHRKDAAAIGSGLGRVTLMLHEALAEHADDPIKQHADFKNRIASISSKSLQDKANKFADSYDPQKEPRWGEIALDALVYQKYMAKQKNDAREEE